MLRVSPAAATQNHVHPRRRRTSPVLQPELPTAVSVTLLSRPTPLTRLCNHRRGLWMADSGAPRNAVFELHHCSSKSAPGKPCWLSKRRIPRTLLQVAEEFTPRRQLGGLA